MLNPLTAALGVLGAGCKYQIEHLPLRTRRTSPGVNMAARNKKRAARRHRAAQIARASRKTNRRVARGR